MKRKVPTRRSRRLAQEEPEKVASQAVGSEESGGEPVIELPPRPAVGCKRKRSQREQKPVICLLEPESKPDRSNRKGKRHKQWDQQRMDMAVQAVKGKQMSTHAAAAYYGVPKSSLNDRVKEKVAVNAKTGAKQKLHASDERAVVQYAQAFGKFGFPLKPQRVRNKARELAEKRGTDACLCCQKIFYAVVVHSFQ